MPAAGILRLTEKVLVAAAPSPARPPLEGPGPWATNTCTVSLPAGPGRAATDLTGPMMGTRAAKACGPTSHNAPYSCRQGELA